SRSRGRSMARSGWRPLALLLLCGGLAAAAHAQSAPISWQRIDQTDINVAVMSPWPQSVRRGYAPVRLELENRGAEPAEIDVRIRCYGGVAQTEVVDHVMLAAGARVTDE